MSRERWGLGLGALVGFGFGVTSCGNMNQVPKVNADQAGGDAKQEIVLSGDCFQKEGGFAGCLLDNINNIRLQNGTTVKTGLQGVMKATDQAKAFPFTESLTGKNGKCISTNREGGYGSLVCSVGDGKGFSAFVTNTEDGSFIVSDVMTQVEVPIITAENKKIMVKKISHKGIFNPFAPKACGQIHSEIGKSREVLSSIQLGLDQSGEINTTFLANNKYVGWSVDLPKGETCPAQK